MNQLFYIRIRGIEQGPFDEDQLQLLVRRGQLARIHEISKDRQQWDPAEEYPHLFVSVVPVRSLGAEQVAQIDSGPLTLRQAEADTVHGAQADTGVYHSAPDGEAAYDHGAVCADDQTSEESEFPTRRKRRQSSSKSPLDTILQLLFVLMILGALAGVAYKFMN